MSVNRGNGGGEHDDVVVRKAEHGWIVGDESVADLTSAMVLADLFAADQSDDDATALEAVDDNGEPRRAVRRPSAPAPRASDSGEQRLPTVTDVGDVTDRSSESGEAERLAVTVAQLEHALASRVRVEQAIGVLAERHRLRPREAFDLLRSAARADGQKLTELAGIVVDSASNPLLPLPATLARQAGATRQRGPSPRRSRARS